MGRQGKMHVTTIQSKFLKEEMEIKIYQPGTFSTGEKQHICIMQDGNDYFQLGRIATLSDQLHEEDVISNTFFVGIHYEDKYDRHKKYDPSGEKNDAYISFLMEEVVPFLEKHIPAWSEDKIWALMGDSLAGTLALMTASKYPDIFTKVIMQSPYVGTKVIDAVKNAASLTDMEIYHSIGDGETNVTTTEGTKEDFLTPNRQLYELLSNKQTSAYHYREIDGGKHTWKYWQKEMKQLLTTMFT